MNSVSTNAEVDGVTTRTAPPGPRARLARAAAGLYRFSGSNGLLSVVDQATVSAVSFLTAVMIGRTSKEMLGLYCLAQTFVLFARGIQAQLIFAPYVVHAQRHQGESAREYTGSVLAQQLILAGVAGALALAALPVLGFFGPAELVPVVPVLAVVIPVLMLREFCRAHGFCNFRMGRALALDLTHAVLQLTALFGLLYFGRFSIPMAYAAIGGSAAAVCVRWWFVERGTWRVRPSRIATDWRRNWSFARWALASHLVGSASALVLPWLLQAVQGPGVVGLYGGCVTLAGAASMFVVGLGNYLSPKAAQVYAKGHAPALKRLVVRAYLIFLAVIGTFCVVCFFAGETILVLVYQNRFAGGGPVLTVCALSVLAISLGLVGGNGLWAMNRPHATFLPDLLGATVALSAAAAWSRPYGAMGAACATLAGTVVAGGLTSWRLRQALRSAPSEEG